MIRFFLIALLSASGLLMSGCGGAFVWDPYGSETVTGTVIVVHVTPMDDSHSAPIAMSSVTLANGSTATTINVCGDQSIHFPLNQVVRATISTDTPCSTLLSAVLL